MKRYDPGRSERRALRRLAVLLLAMALPLAGCDLAGDLLEVNDPDIVEPAELEGPVGRQALFFGSLGVFANAYEEAILVSGLLTDEWAASGTFPTREQFDQRQIFEQNGTLDNFFRQYQSARAGLERALEALRQAEAEGEDVPAGRIPLLLDYLGYTLTFLAEEFCSGVPLSSVNVATGEVVFGEQRTTEELLTLALDRFNAALAAATAAEATQRAYLARVGKARALVDLGRFEEAAQAVAPVPTDFVSLVQRSGNSGFEENDVFILNVRNERWSIANQEGDFVPPFLPTENLTIAQDDEQIDNEGLPFLAARDVRVPWNRQIEGGEPDLGFDGETPQYNLLGYPAFGIQLSREAELPLASGIEARLIEAEAALQNGDIAAMTAILNDLRANVALANLAGFCEAEEGEAPPESCTLPPLEQPDSREEAVDLLFSERAFWLYATTHRQPDLRRLIAQYGRSASDVFPEGEYFEGGFYGEEVVFPIPFLEENNPGFEGCLRPTTEAAFTT